MDTKRRTGNTFRPGTGLFHPGAPERVSESLRTPERHHARNGSGTEMPGYLKHSANGRTVVFAGLWRVTESPQIARYPCSGKERKRVLGVPRCRTGAVGVRRHRRKHPPRLDCDIFLIIATKARRVGINCGPRVAPKRFQLYSGVPSIPPRP